MRVAAGMQVVWFISLSYCLTVGSALLVLRPVPNFDAGAVGNYALVRILGRRVGRLVDRSVCVSELVG